MRTLRLALLAAPALLGGAPLAAQAIERSDVPDRGVLRITFEPRNTEWERRFTGGTTWQWLGAPLTGPIGAGVGPTVARLEQDLRTASGLPNLVAGLGSGRFSVRQERRDLPITAQLGLTDRLAVSVTIPIVRVATRAHLALSPSGANLGLNPRLTTAGADQQYTDFFKQFDTTLARLDANIGMGGYGCTPGPCAARTFSQSAHAVRDALYRTVYGVGQTGSPFVPRAGSDAGIGIDTTVARIGRTLDSTYGVRGFTDPFLLAADSLAAGNLEAAIVDSAFGLGYQFLPFRNGFLYALGDVELAAKYRFAAGPSYAAALEALVRLPTAARDSAGDLLGLPVGDHQTDFEARVLQELVVANRVWLNFAVRAGTQRPGIRERRIAPFGAFLVPQSATACLRWEPGDYVGVDFAPLYRFAPGFGAGVTLGYWSRARDHYAFQSAQDSAAVATRYGAPLDARVLDVGTSERRLRLGVAVTFVSGGVEGGLSVEQTLSGSGGLVPVATVFRVVMRTSWRLF